MFPRGKHVKEAFEYMVRELQTDVGLHLEHRGPLSWSLDFKHCEYLTLEVVGWKTHYVRLGVYALNEIAVLFVQGYHL